MSQQIQSANQPYKQLELTQIKIKPESLSLQYEDAMNPLAALKNIDLNIRTGEFLCIIGEIGSGKSSLLSSVIGDLKHVTMTDSGLEEAVGTPIILRGKMSYVQQVPWIQSLTIRENILFGEEMDQEKYKKTIRLCELQRDLDMFPARDMTQIGENGINISGGQKARLSLARAVYSDRDVVLMDDPISALDATVRKKIFENCLTKHLQGKTRILVTHSLDFLHLVDRIIVMKEGRIAFNGNYDDFRDSSYHVENLPSLNRLSSSGQSSEEVQIEDQQFIAIKLKELEKELFTNEDDEKTSVKLSIYKQYLRMAGGVPRAILTGFLITMTIFSIYLNDYWIGFISSKDDQLNRLVYYFGIYFALISALLVIEAARMCNRQLFGIKVSRKIHQNTLTRILRAPVNKFFDITPAGRVINRFSQDISKVDQEMPRSMHQIMFSNSWLFYSTLMACILSGWPVLPLPLLGFISIKLLRYYQPANRQLSRLQTTSRSPIFQLLGEMINGSSTIRAFGKQEEFNKKMKEKLDAQMNVGIVNKISSSLFSLCLYNIAFVFICVAGVLIIQLKDYWSPAIIGLVLTEMLYITFNIRWVFDAVLWNQRNLVSFERLINYCQIVQEAPQYVQEKDPVDLNWPRNPTIQYKDYWLRYREDTEVVLKGLSFSIKGGEKIGIMGRTGAGKSTICLSLLRLVEPMKGEIFIDGVDITKIGLSTLRQRITIIPQDPALFKGTLRYNLDPLEQFKEEHLRALCERSKLCKVYENDQAGLDMEIEEGGSNLSSGEKQVLCICRALLQKSKIIVMDEATANIDHETEGTIQELIKEGFKNATVLVVAHRINTIIHSDRVMVMDDGQMKEFDNPQVLLKDKTSLFYDLVKELEKKSHKQQ